MQKTSKNRIKTLAIVFSSFILATLLLLYAIQGDLNHYYSLKSFASGEIPIGMAGIRVGGMVEKGSLQREGETLTVTFRITDFVNPSMSIIYQGILPDLFSEDQGIIARGTLNENGIFYANEILAKHDENYMPPEVANDMKNLSHSIGYPSQKRQDKQ